MVRMDLAQVIINEASDAQMIVLREREGSRAFSILIGTSEAAAIDRGLNERRLPRPMTHDLIDNVLTTLGVALERIVVNDLRDKTFFARLILQRDGETLEVDSRPSDAIALAVARNTPIYVEEKVLDAVCRSDGLD